MPRRAEAAPARAAAQLDIASPTRPCRCDALQRPRARERPQLALQRLGVVISKIAQLAEPGPLCGDRALASSDKRLQRLAFPAAHGVDGRSVARTLRAARTASRLSVLPPERRSLRSRPTSSTRCARPVRKRVSPSPYGPVRSIANARRPGRVLLDDPQRLGVAVAVCQHRRLGDEHAADDVHDRERVRVAVRVDTDDLVS